MSQTKVKSGLLNFPDQTDFVKLPSGTTAQRPVSPEEGYTRFNTTTDKLEFFDGVRWVTAGETPPTLTSVDYPGNALAADIAGGETILINGTNFASGISVTIGTTDVSVVTLNSPTQLAITSPALTAGDYDVKVTNLDGSTITALDFISYNGVPSWVTASGSLGSLNFGEAISTITLSATEPDSGVVTYAVTSGALPVGLTLSSSGEITGTMPSGSSETTYSFTVTATDDENQSTDRAFTITGVVPFVNSQNFSAVAYTAQSIPYAVNVGFRPDLIWVKSRTNAYNHGLFDTLRDNGRYLKTNTTDAESPSNDTAFHTLTDTGFTWTENSGGYNATGDYVAWCWKAGGAPSSNTDGTITSQVSANLASGFSVVSYNGNSTSGATVGHGLTQTPKIIIYKRRDATSNWIIKSSILGADNYVLFTNGQLEADSGVFWNSTLPNSSVFTLGNSASVNVGTYIAYCFAEVAGFSKIGSYIGTGASNIISTGFEPAFLMMKKTSGTTNSHWLILDNKRDASNSRSKELYANLNNAENNLNRNVNFLSNGFELTSSAYTNDNGDSYIYMAFAADPNTQVPTKADSFNTVTYTGNRVDASTTNPQVIGFQPDFTWVKIRTQAYSHLLMDSVRGGGFALYSDGAFAETGVNNNFGGIDFVPNGIVVNSSVNAVDGLNKSGDNFVAWNWKAGGTPSINTDGSITSIVSANPAAGFSIVSYTGNQLSNQTIGHGLGKTPDMIITKGRANLSLYDQWDVWHKDLTLNYILSLQGTDAEGFAGVDQRFVTSLNSDTVFGVGWDDFGPNSNGTTKIAYCFAEIAGFSKFGSYTGTGASGNFQDCGFEPAFVMLRSSSNAGNWRMWDNKRSTSDPRNRVIIANGSNSEFYPDVSINFTSTGFSFNTSGSNDSGQTFIYMAFANQF